MKITITYDDNGSYEEIALPESLEGKITQVKLDGLDGPSLLLIIELVVKGTTIAANCIVIGQFISTILKNHRNANVAINGKPIPSDASESEICHAVETAKQQD